DHQHLSIISLQSGHWPDSKTIAVEASQAVPYGVPPAGGVIYFEVNNRAKAVELGGTVRDPIQAPPPFSQNVAFYSSREMMERLAGSSGISRIHFTIDGATKEEVDAVASALEKKINKEGVTVAFVLTYA